jgi:hypothetical protein
MLNEGSQVQKDKSHMPICEVLKGRISFALMLQNLVSTDRNFGPVRVCRTVLLAQVTEREKNPSKSKVP